MKVKQRAGGSRPQRFFLTSMGGCNIKKLQFEEADYLAIGARYCLCSFDPIFRTNPNAGPFKQVTAGPRHGLRLQNTSFCILPRLYCHSISNLTHTTGAGVQDRGQSLDKNGQKLHKSPSQTAWARPTDPTIVFCCL